MKKCCRCPIRGHHMPTCRVHLFDKWMEEEWNKTDWNRIKHVFTSWWRGK